MPITGVSCLSDTSSGQQRHHLASFNLKLNSSPANTHPPYSYLHLRLATPSCHRLGTMSTISEAPCDAWMRHYTSNRIGELELDAILRSLIEQGLVLQTDGAGNPKPENKLKDANSHNTDTDTGKHDRINHNTDKYHASACTLLWADFPEAPSAPRKRNSDDDASALGLHDVVEEGLGRHKLVGALKRIVDAISATALPGLQPTGRYISAEIYCMDSDSEERPFRLPDRWEPPYKQACHAMHSDCRRTHTYNITIEDTQIMLWYFSRSHFARSSAYSFFVCSLCSVC
ncbi:hypothetical protein C2E23DRAFT_463947 [Lenzites betulinus]|nr:hypothetical protein C2E23DRAFT_463947 [Lenzites betulinus]